MSDFQTELEELLDRHVVALGCQDHDVMPIIEDYVIVVGITDAAGEGGGLYVGAKSNTPLYRTIGLLEEAKDLVKSKGAEHGA